MRIITLIFVLFVSACSNDNTVIIQPPVIQPPTTPVERPIANAGYPMQLQQGATAMLDGSRSYDPKGAALTYSWSIVSQPAGSTSTLVDADKPFASLYLDVVGDYELQLVVNNGTEDSLASTIRVSDSDSVPVANAGYDRSFSGTSPVTLDGSRSYDSDGDALTFAWSIVSAPSGSAAVLARDTGPFPVLTPDVSGQYTIELVVSDGTQSSSPDTVVVTDSNVAPVADAGLATTYTLNTAVVLDGTGSFDNDGDNLTYLWQVVSVPSGSAAMLTDATRPHPSITPDVAGNYVVSLIVNDGQVDSAASTVTLRADDHVPVADAGRDLSGQLGQLVHLDGTGSVDADGDPLTPRWSFVSKPKNSATQLVNVHTKHPYFTPDVDGDYVIKLQVFDGTHLSAPDSVVVSTSNLAPVADAGPAQLVSTGQTVHLDGSGSSDPEGAALTFNWSIASAPTGSTAQLSDTSVVAPDIVPDVSGAYVLQLVVSDGSLSSSPSTVVITDSSVNLAPTADAGPDQSVSNGTTVNLNGANSSDPEGATLAYQWSMLSTPIGSAATLINDATATPHFMVDVSGDYVAQLTVTDDQNLVDHDVVIIRDGASSNTLPVANAGADLIVDVNTQLTLQGLATDADNDSLSYQWFMVSRPVGSAASLSLDNTLTPNFTPDVDGDYVIQFIVSDGTSTGIPDVVIVHRTLKNLKPIAFSSTPLTGTTQSQITLDGSLSSDPNGDALTYRWALTAPAASASMLSSSTAVMPTFTPDIAGSYLVSLVVNDGTLNSDKLSFTILVTDPPPGSAIVLPSGHNLMAISTEGGAHQVGVLYSVQEAAPAQTTSVVEMGGVPGIVSERGSQSIVMHPDNGKAYALLMEAGVYRRGAILEYDPTRTVPVKYWGSVPEFEVSGYVVRDFSSRLLFHPDGMSAYAYSTKGGENDAGVIVHINFDESSPSYKTVTVIAEPSKAISGFAGTPLNLSSNLYWSGTNRIIAVFGWNRYSFDLPALEFSAATPLTGASSTATQPWTTSIFSNAVTARGRFIAFDQVTDSIVVTYFIGPPILAVGTRQGGGLGGDELRSCATPVGTFSWGNRQVFALCNASTTNTIPGLYSSSFAAERGSLERTFSGLSNVRIEGLVTSDTISRLYMTVNDDLASTVAKAPSGSGLALSIQAPTVREVATPNYTDKAVITGDSVVGGSKGVMFLGDPVVLNQVPSASGTQATSLNDQYVGVLSYNGGDLGEGALLGFNREDGSQSINSFGFHSGGFPFGRVVKSQTGGYYYSVAASAGSVTTGTTMRYDDTLGTTAEVLNKPRFVRTGIGLQPHVSNGLMYGIGIDLVADNYLVYSINSATGEYQKVIDLEQTGRYYPQFELTLDDDNYWALTDQRLRCAAIGQTTGSALYDFVSPGPNDPVRKPTLDATGNFLYVATRTSAVSDEGAIVRFANDCTVITGTTVAAGLQDIPSTALVLASNGSFYYGTENGKIMMFDGIASTEVAAIADHEIVGFLIEDSNGDIVGFAESTVDNTSVSFAYPVSGGSTITKTAVPADKPIDPIYPGFTEIN